MVVGLIALFLALGGVSYAKQVVHLIDGSTIKKGSIQVDRLSKRAQLALRGHGGSQGIQGLRGVPGSQGIQGIPGIQGVKGEPGTPGAPGAALGWAHVLADGTVDSGHNVSSANVTKAFPKGFCFTGLGFVPHAAVASLDGFNFTAGSTDAAQVKIGNGFTPGQCPEGVQVEVFELLTSGTGAPFSIIFE